MRPNYPADGVPGRRQVLHNMRQWADKPGQLVCALLIINRAHCIVLWVIVLSKRFKGLPTGYTGCMPGLSCLGPD